MNTQPRPFGGGALRALRLGIGLLGLCLASVSSAATFYVATNGNDNNPGTQSQPFLTISKAVSSAFSGDTIIMGAGTFPASSRLNLRPGVNLHGQGPTTSIIQTTASDFGIYMNSTSHITTGQTLQNFGLRPAVLRSSTNIGIEMRQRSNVVFHNLRIEGFNTSGLWIKSQDTTTEPSFYLQGIVIRHSTFINTGSRTASNEGLGAVMIKGLQGALIHNNTINEDTGFGLKFWGGGWFKGIKVYNNTINTSDFFPGVWQSGCSIELWNLYDDCEIHDNTLNQWTSFVRGDKGAGTWAARIYRNTITFSTANPVKEAFEINLSDVELYDNVAIRAKIGVVTFEGGAVRTNVVIRDNVFYWPTGSGGTSGVYMDQRNLGGANGWRVYHNVFDGYVYGLRISPNGAGVHDLRFRNNVVARSTHLVEIRNVGSASNVSGLLVTHNGAHHTGAALNNLIGAPITFNNNVLTSTIGGLGLTLTGARPDPYYVPLSSSPLIDAGINVGYPYAGLAPDIGLFESVAGHLVDFETSEGYANGNLGGQPASGPVTWSGSGNGLVVQTAAAYNGARAIRSQNPSSTQTFAYNPTNGTGGVFPANLDNATGNANKVRFSFRYAYQTLNTGSGTNFIEQYFGSAGAATCVAQINWKANGQLQLIHGGGNLIITSGPTLNQFYLVELEADYQALTVRVLVDGVVKGTFPFKANPKDDTIAFRVPTSSVHQNVVIDLLRWELLP